MTFQTSIQSLNGPHTPSGFGITSCGVDWSRNRVFIGTSSSFISRVGLITGIEEIYRATASNEFPPVGVDANGNIYRAGPNTLSAGGIQQINGETLTAIATGAYPPPAFGGGGFALVAAATGNFALDLGPATIITSQTRTTVSKDAVFLDTDLWANGASAFTCAGEPLSNKGFYIESPPSAGTQELTLHYVLCGVSLSFVTVGTVAATAIDATWTNIRCNGICCDQTDGNMVVIVYTGDSVTNQLYLAKISSTDASVMWTVALPNFGPATPPGGVQFGQSRIRNQRISILTSGNGMMIPRRVTTVNTADGSSTSFTAGLAGLAPFGPQCYDDTIGGIVGLFSYVQQAGSPIPLNSTPSSYIGWQVLYVAPAFGPGRRFLSESGPIRIIQ